MALFERLPFGFALVLKSAPVFPAAAIRLEDIEKSLNLYLHALKRSCEQKVVVADQQRRLAQAFSPWRHLQSLVRLEHGHANLPEVIQRFAEPSLNRDLYYWLAAYMAFDQPLPAPATNQSSLAEPLAHLLQGVMTSARVLKACPGLKSRYQRLSLACLTERESMMPSFRGMSVVANSIEAGIRYALGDKSTQLPNWLRHAVDAAEVGLLLPDPPSIFHKPGILFWPAAVWGQPRQLQPARPDFIEDLIEEEFLERKPIPPENPEQVTEEDYLDEPEEEKGEELTGTYLYPEWHFKRECYRENWCHVIEAVQESEGWAEPPSELKRLSRRVRRQFEALRTDDRWLRRLHDGEEINLDDFIEAVAERRACGHASERLYQHRKRDDRELAVMVLLDVSNSTQFQLGGTRVIDVERQAMIVMAEALAEVGDVFSIYAFSGYARTQVDCLRVKGFEENYDDKVRERIFSLTPRGSTRIGAALRHMGKRLARRPERHRLLLLLTDGRPFDPADNYTGRYALEDTRKALQELNAEGIYAYGLTIDQAGLEYLPYLFGPGKYTVFSNVLALPEFLPRLYARLTGLGQ